MNKSASITPAVLEGLEPLRELTPEALEALAEEAEIEDVPARSIIYRKDAEDVWVRYLLSGSVLLVERDDEGHLLLSAEDADAAQPLGLQQPHRETAIAYSECRLLRLRSARIAELLEANQPPEYEVDEISDQGDAGTQLFLGLVQDLMEERLELPSMPDIAVRVREAISERDAGPAELSKILQNDPAVAARVVQAANSALFAGQSPADNLTAAIVRLGVKNTREVVTAVTMREVFQTRNPLLNKRMVEVWMHSTLVAAIAALLARKLKGFSSDRALLAGLVHDIGVVPMLAHAGDYPELARDPAALEAIIQEYRGQIGSMILRRWNFPDDLVVVPLEADNRQREHAGRADYADLIVLAKQLALSSAGGIDTEAIGELPVVKALETAGLSAAGAGAL